MDAASPVPPPELRVAVLFDGNNWYRSMREYLRPEQGKTDYPALVNWIVAKLRETLGLPENAPIRFETWYFTAIPEDSADFRERLLGFLRSIEREGINVRRLPMRRCLVTYTLECPDCKKPVTGQVIRYEEEQVDVAIAVKLVELSFRHQIDVAVLVSGDSDYLPAVATAQEEGVRVYVASLSLPSISHDLKRAANGHIDMAEGLRLSLRAPPVGSTGNGGGEPSGTT